MPMPSIVKAMNIVFSRPIRSEMKPNSGRETPLRMRSSIRAKGRAAMAKKYRLTLNSFTPRSCAITPSCATAMRPPVTVQVNIRSITQKTGVRRASPRV
ncbi:hypothetical protein OCOJLMKI_5313 [Methylobacterium iners]|uniref:Uncharacterized protein n=1 Tax=Methylobacterium iners TaxID=418707 RepID=A0ABQ4S6G3_9HYPH|nr:hypothetical protein OCOJLMKI_5313 [Methylobacterium iners]